MTISKMYGTAVKYFFFAKSSETIKYSRSNDFCNTGTEKNAGYFPDVAEKQKPNRKTFMKHPVQQMAFLKKKRVFSFYPLDIILFMFIITNKPQYQTT